MKVGVAFSRFQTKYFQGKYGDLDSAVISYGPCQTPTLGFCVERYDEIQSFSPENFWNVDVCVDVHGKVVLLEWQRGRLFDQGIIETFVSIIQDDTDLICSSVKTSESQRTRPQPMNTVEMLKMASSRLGLSPMATMRAAEDLYLSGYLSYPRTESTSYPPSFDIRDALAGLRHHSDRDVRECVQFFLDQGFNRPRQGVDKGDHPPITPVNLASDLFGDKARLYDMIVRHFLATVTFLLLNQ